MGGRFAAHTKFYLRAKVPFNEEHTVTKNYHLDFRTGGSLAGLPVSWEHG